MDTDTRKWWKEAVIYQIYPRSFKDSNNDGIGDLQGVISELDYLKQLGIDVIWMSPVYQSPNADNGYDISDYCAIMKEFGTMQDWELMIEEMHKRGIKLLMDLVINHTSDEHQWFQKSREKRDDNPYRDFYFWRPPKNGREPNNWTSFFSGSVWEEYYLHLFATKQPDLNWENPQVREELMKMIKWWLDKGVDGFRMDAINVISKPEGLPDDAPGHIGVSPYYFDGPRFVEFVTEIKTKVFDKYDMFTVGEMNATPELAEKYTQPTNGICNMLFHFEHTNLDTIPGHLKWDYCALNLEKLKNVMSMWQNEIRQGWNTLYIENHDQPRSVSRFGDDKYLRVESAKMLATWLYFMKGTPFIYQGQEIGMTNIELPIEEYDDLETKNYYKEEILKGKSKEELMGGIHRKSRDNARTPMQWSGEENAGFSGGKPWLPVNPNYKEINVEKDLKDPNSVLNYYKKLIQLRKRYPIIIYGNYRLILKEHQFVYAYVRSLNKQQLLVVCNFSGKEQTFTLENSDLSTFTKNEVIIGNYPGQGKLEQTMVLKPWESFVYLLEE